jgi:hypothetical protein
VEITAAKTNQIYQEWFHVLIPERLATETFRIMVGIRVSGIVEEFCELWFEFDQVCPGVRCFGVYHVNLLSFVVVHSGTGF